MYIEMTRAGGAVAYAGRGWAAVVGFDGRLMESAGPPLDKPGADAWMAGWADAGARLGWRYRVIDRLPGEEG